MGLYDGLTDYGDPGFAKFLRGAFASSMGYGTEALERPVVGITYTASDFNNCHRLAPELIEAVKRGVMLAGALPMVFPTASLGEGFLNPTSMYFRNMMAMETEELVRGQPMDAVVLIGGCDKTIPAQLMAALSVNKPAIVVPVGPMMTGSYEGERLGACTDCRRYWARYRGGSLKQEQLERLQSRLAATAGTCPVMGTASTMASLVETLGLTLPGGASIPAPAADRLRLAEESGRVAAAMASDGGPTPRHFVTEASVENALRMLLAISGSTNALIHLTAIARRAGITVDLERFNQLSAETPVVVSLKPTGGSYMEDFHNAGGVGSVLRELRTSFNLDTPSIAGGTIGDHVDFETEWRDGSVIRPANNPVDPEGGLVALFGSLAPTGAILKRAAATPDLFERTGRAVVFTSPEDLAARIDDPDLDVTAEDFLVMQNAGPLGAGMPEAGYLPIPKKLLAAGVTDMVRLSDARMSGTAYGTVVLHISPESAAGGPLSKVRDGDLIRLSVAEQRLDLLVEDAELAAREPVIKVLDQPGAYGALFRSEVMQAPDGCDFRSAVSGPVP
jgi:dihydroxy-acid dehydratase